jgi:S-adenosylmethionine:tRNA ribosyltransferase-isomerase
MEPEAHDDTPAPSRRPRAATLEPAAWPRERPEDERLLRVDAGADLVADARLGDLPSLLTPGDVLVVNDAATLPASLRGETARGEEVEARLMAHGASDREWTALLLGAGDARQRTEDRAPPPCVAEGDRLALGPGLGAVVTRVDDPRRVGLRFEASGAELWQALFAAGRPIQYAYVRAPYALWHVQTRFASRPWAFELPSAGRPLTWEILLALRQRGVALAWITHAAGISSTGSAACDRALPVPERYEVPEATARAIGAARARGGRVIAAGTTVVRALESAAAGDGLGPARGVRTGRGEARLVIDAKSPLAVVDGLLTGMHVPGTSHFALLEALAPRPLLERALTHAAARGYLEHEMGDSCLVLRGLGPGLNNRKRRVQAGATRPPHPRNRELASTASR